MRLPLLQQPAAHPDGRRALEDALGATIEGEVRFDAASRAAYSTDASNYRRIPTAVVTPRTPEDVLATLAACREHGVAVVSRGGGTSLNGQCCTDGVVIDCSKYLNRILEIDPEARTARVQPGVVLDSLSEQTLPHDLIYGPDPATHSHCTFGGMLGNNSCGVHSVLAGRSSDNVIEMEVATSDGARLTVGRAAPETFRQRIAEGGRIGEIYRGLDELRGEYADDIRDRYPDIPRRVSGYNLPDLLEENGCNLARALVGSEGTCIAILEATVRLVRWPPHRALLVLGYESVYEAGDHVPEVMEARPIGLEGMGQKLVDQMEIKGVHPDEVKILPEGDGWLLVEFGGETSREAEEAARALMDRLGAGNPPKSMELVADPEQEARIWAVRESGLAATAFVPGMSDTWPGWEDAAVPPDRVGDYLRRFRALLDEFDYDCSLYGHFGQGCIHCRIDFDLVTAGGVSKYRDFVHRAADLVVEHGGSLSAEHGDALAKSELLPKMYGQRLIDAFRRFKRIWDPAGIMNPGKIVDPDPLDDHLRLGAHYAPGRLDTELKFPDSGGSFERAAIRCVGVGKCRRRKDAFMCPSYTATQEEIHTTRGRARLLFEMVRGDFITDSWRSEAVRESLDLCLACKGCKKECPVGVDMAQYKAEFLHHYYRGRLRPRAFYAMGHVGALADIAALAPGVANWFATTPGLAAAGKWLAGVEQQRELPRFAPRTFQAWFKSRPAPGPAAEGRGPVLLIPDAFNDHFFPQTLRAATEVLEALGYAVELPPWRYPAARPLIHYGFLPQTRRLLERLLPRLDRYAAAGAPIVGVEPSTVAVLRDELQSFFPGDPRARRIHDGARMLSEFLAEHHAGDLPRPGGACLFHAHCHQKAVLEAGAARAVLGGMGFRVREPEPGCCGMAGSFGFERRHADLARRIGEANLLPAVRSAAPDETVVIEGFSCREQIRQETGRAPSHLAEVVAAAMS